MLHMCSQLESLCPSRCYDRGIVELWPSTQYLIGVTESTPRLQPTYAHARRPSTLLPTILGRRMRYTAMEVGGRDAAHL